MKSKILLAIAISSTGFLLLAGCNDQKGLIPYNEDRARQHIIPIEQARAFQKTFSDTRSELTRLIQDTSFLSKRFNLPNAESFNRDAIALLLNQEGADGIRIFYGTDPKGGIRLILLPIDKNGKTIINALIGNQTSLNVPGISPANAQVTRHAIENGQVCPPCPID